MTSSDEAESPAWISDSEAETIWMSRIAMNIPNTMKTNAAIRRAEKFGAAAGAKAGRAAAGSDAPGARRATASLTAWGYESRRLRAQAR